MTERNPPPTAPPWWARFTQSIMTTLAGFAVAVFAVTLLRATGVAEGVWLAVMLTGLGGAGFGPSLASRGTPPNERGTVRVGVLVAALVVFVAVPIAFALAGCGAIQVAAEREITWKRRPGSTCYVATLADGELATEATAPTSCVPPPEFCQPGPGEPGFDPSIPSETQP